MKPLYRGPEVRGFLPRSKPRPAFAPKKSPSVEKKVHGTGWGTEYKVAAKPDDRMIGVPSKGGNTGLSDCALLLAKGYANPFGKFEDLPCVPCTPPQASFRERVVTRSTATTSSSTAATGSITIIPIVGGNNTQSIFYTNSSYVGAGSPFPKTGTGVASSTRTLKFAQSSFDDVQGRLVALGLRVRNITKLANVEGVLRGLVLESDDDISTHTEALIAIDPRLTLAPQSFASPDAEGWYTLIWRPMDQSDLDYHGGSEDFAFPTVPSMGFSWTQSAGNPQTYQWEVVEFWEYIGESVANSVAPGGLTDSHSDPVGLSRVLEGIQTNPLTLAAEDWQKHSAQSIVDAIAHSDSVAKTVEALAGVAGLGDSPIVKLAGSLLGFFAL